MSTNSGQIFIVAEPTDAGQAKFETAAAAAEREAPNRTVAKEVEQNAEQAQDVAKQAALAAHSMGSGMTGETPTIDALQSHANAAAAEGKANFESAKAKGAGYLDQASSMASGALASAQSYLPVQGQSGSNKTGSNNEGSGVGSQIQSGAAAALFTAKEYISAAQNVAQPHVDNARSTLQPHIDSATAAAQPHIDRARETVQSYIGGGNPPASKT